MNENFQRHHLTNDVLERLMRIRHVVKINSKTNELLRMTVFIFMEHDNSLPSLERELC